MADARSRSRGLPAYGNVHPYIDCNARAYVYSYADGHANANSNPNASTHGNAYASPNSDSHSGRVLQAIARHAFRKQVD